MSQIYKMQNNTADIDLIELFLFLRKKVISIVSFVVFSLVLSSVFLWANKNKVSINYELNIMNNSPGMIVNCGDEFYCKANIIQSVIKNTSRTITSETDEKRQAINLSWAGDIRDKTVVIAEVNAIHQAIDDWYIQDYQTYKSIVDNQGSSYTNDSDIYAKVLLLTKSFSAGKTTFISVSNETVSKVYKPALFMTLSFILAIIVSSAYHIIKRSVHEYKNKLNRSFDSL